MRDPRHTFLIVVSAACVWLILGMASAAPVHRSLVEGCREGLGTRPALLGHIVAWPVSVLATMGLRSGC